MRDEGDDAVAELAPDAVTPVGEAPAPVDVPPEKLAVEEWAHRKGLLPFMLEAPQPGQPTIAFGLDGKGMPVHRATPVASGLAPRVNANYWKFAAAKAHESWPEGWTVTEAEFDRIVEHVTNGVQLSVPHGSQRGVLQKG